MSRRSQVILWTILYLVLYFALLFTYTKVVGAILIFIGGFIVGQLIFKFAYYTVYQKWPTEDNVINDAWDDYRKELENK